jgi:hypothetical protein
MTKTSAHMHPLPLLILGTTGQNGPARPSAQNVLPLFAGNPCAIIRHVLIDAFFGRSSGKFVNSTGQASAWHVTFPSQRMEYADGPG